MVKENKILQILDSHNIEYATSGKNIGKKAIAGLPCVFCGDDDGYHLGIMKGKLGYFYTCWKNSDHKGSIEYLFSKLLNISLSQAKDLLKSNVVEEDLLDKLDEICYIKKNMRKLGGVSELTLPDNFRKLSSIGPGRMFIQYLLNRGFDTTDKLIQNYNLHYCVSGDYDKRIIFPITIDEKPVTYTGRSIMSNPGLRYRDLEINKSIRHIKYCLFNYDGIKNGSWDDTLYITEGIFDAMKIGWGTEFLTSATCLFTTSIRDEQVLLLSKVIGKFKEIFVVFDKNAETQAGKIVDELSFLGNVKYKRLPKGVDDPGDMTKEQVKEFVYG